MCVSNRRPCRLAPARSNDRAGRHPGAAIRETRTRSGWFDGESTLFGVAAQVIHSANLEVPFLTTRDEGSKTSDKGQVTSDQ